MPNRTYKTIILDTDGDDSDPVLIVGHVDDQVYISIGQMADTENSLKIKKLTPEVQVPRDDLLIALGLVPEVKESNAD